VLLIALVECQALVGIVLGIIPIRNDTIVRLALHAFSSLITMKNSMGGYRFSTDDREEGTAE
jgi:hypothetical protein